MKISRKEKLFRKSSSEREGGIQLDVIQLGGECSKLEEITVVKTKIQVFCNTIQTLRRPCCIHLQGLCVA